MTLALGLPTLILPFGKDQAEYALTADRALHGQVTYRDIFCVKPPATPAIHALALLTFGRSMVSIRVLDLIWQGLMALVVAAIARQLSPRRGFPLLSVLLYLMTYYSFYYGDIAQTDGFLALPAAVAVLAFLVAQRTNSVGTLIACGAGIGVAVLFKPPIGIL